MTSVNLKRSPDSRYMKNKNSDLNQDENRFPLFEHEEHVKLQHDHARHLNENTKLVIPMLPLVIKSKTSKNTNRPSTIPKNYDNSNDNNKLSKFVNISKRGFKKVVQEVIKFAIPPEHRRIMNINYWLTIYILIKKILWLYDIHSSSMYSKTFRG